MENGAALLKELLIPACMVDTHGNIYASTVGAVVPQTCEECPSNNTPGLLESLRLLDEIAANERQQAADGLASEL